MRGKCMQCCCSTPPDVFLAEAVPQLCAAPWCWEAGEGCLVTKCLVCSLFSGFWPSLNTLLWRERRWIVALRLSTQRKEHTLMDIECLFHFPFLFAFFSAFFKPFSFSLHLLLLPSASCLESNGVFEVNPRFAERFWTNSRAGCLLFNLHDTDMETQQTAANLNTGKWITVNAGPEEDLTSTAPEMMVFAWPGHKKIQSSLPSFFCWKCLWNECDISVRGGRTTFCCYSFKVLMFTSFPAKGSLCV